MTKEQPYDLLRSFMTKERWERFALFHEGIPLLLAKNKRIAQKTDEQIPNPGKGLIVMWNNHIPKMDDLPKAFLLIILAAKWPVQDSRISDTLYLA